MEELRCKHCNSTDFKRIQGFWVCAYCGSKYMAYPDNLRQVEYHLREAEDAYVVEKYKKMKNHIDQALALDPENANAYYWEMKYYEEQGQLVLAVLSGDKAIRYNDGSDSSLDEDIYETYLNCFVSEAQQEGLNDASGQCDHDDGRHGILIGDAKQYQEKQNDITAWIARRYEWTQRKGNKDI